MTLKEEIVPSDQVCCTSTFTEYFGVFGGFWDEIIRYSIEVSNDAILNLLFRDNFFL